MERLVILLLLLGWPVSGLFGWRAEKRQERKNATTFYLTGGLCFYLLQGWRTAPDPLGAMLAAVGTMIIPVVVIYFFKGRAKVRDWQGFSRWFILSTLIVAVLLGAAKR